MKRLTRNQKNSLLDEIQHSGVSIETREIYLHGVDSGEDDAGTDYRMAMRFIKNFRFLESLNDKPIIVHQYNIGGDWSAGMAVYDTIMYSDCHVNFVMHGIAASMGSIIPQAADTRLMMPNCCMLIHFGSTDIYGLDHTTAQSWADWEKGLTDVMMGIYSDACHDSKKFVGKSKAKITECLTKTIKDKGDLWLTATQAVDWGFSDAIIGEEGYESIKSLTENE